MSRRNNNPWMVTVDKPPWMPSVTSYEQREDAIKHALEAVLSWLPGPRIHKTSFLPFLDLVLADEWEAALLEWFAVEAKVSGLRPHVMVNQLVPRKAGFVDGEALRAKAGRLLRKGGA